MSKEGYQPHIPSEKDGGHKENSDSGVSYGSAELEEALHRKIMGMIGLLEWWDAEMASRKQNLLNEEPTIDSN